MNVHDPEPDPALNSPPWGVRRICVLGDRTSASSAVLDALKQAFDVALVEHAPPVEGVEPGDLAVADRAIIVHDLDRTNWAAVITQHPDLIVFVAPTVDGRIEHLLQQFAAHDLTSTAAIVVFCEHDQGDSRSAWLSNLGVQDLLSPLPAAASDDTISAFADPTLIRRLRLAVVRQRRRRAELDARTRDAQALVDRLDSILNAAVDPIVVVNKDGVIRFANTATSEFFEQPLDRMIGIPFGQPLGSDPMQELDVVRRDGAHRIVEMRVVPIDWEGQPASLATLRDITERKRTERTIRDYADQLGLSNRELKRFIYLVSEDMRSPLMTILGYASQMKRPGVAGDAEKVMRYSDRIAFSAQRGLQHLGALLDYGRVAQGAGELQPVDVPELVRSIQSDLRSEIEKRGVRVEVEPNMPMLLAHREHIADLFRNLLENAIQHGCTGSSDPRVWVGAIKMDREVRYFVKDNGPGIPAHHHRRVFDLFEQFGPLNVGAGVGLAIVKRVANIYSGRAWVESKPGEGATFWIAIPTLE